MICSVRLIILLSILTVSDQAASLTYNLTFSGGSPTPTGGSFTYDTVANRFTTFTITWSGLTFNLLPSANSPVTQGTTCKVISGQELYNALISGGQCQGQAIQPLWETFPPNPPGNVFRSSFSLHLFTKNNEGYIAGGSSPDPSFIANRTGGTFVVTLAVTDQPRTDLAVTNSASFAQRSIAPGALLTFFGTNIGPSQAAGLQVINGAVSTSLANTQVLFDDVAAPLIYASSVQTTAVVPFELAGRPSARLRVIYQGKTVYDQPVSVAESAPGLFTANASGSGQLAALNQDGSPNSAGNAAERGTVLQIYATGGGLTNPPGVTGALATGPAALRQEVRVLIGNQDATVQYAGQAPSLVNGVIQINATIPASVVPSPAVPIVVTIGGRSSQTTATVAVR